MNCVFNKITKKFTGTAIKWDTPIITNDEIILVLLDIPKDTDRLNNTNNGIRPATQAEIDADISAAKTAQAQELSSSPQMQAAIEEFVSVLQAASIPVPADIVGNIVNRCKAKL